MTRPCRAAWRVAQFQRMPGVARSTRINPAPHPRRGTTTPRPRYVRTVGRPRKPIALPQKLPSAWRRSRKCERVGPAALAQRKDRGEAVPSGPCRRRSLRRSLHYQASKGTLLACLRPFSARTDSCAPSEGARLSPPPFLVDFNPRDFGPGDFFA
jgi:hypothetical protein